MKTYVLIDNASGFVWDIVKAVDIIEAARITDREHAPDREYDYVITGRGMTYTQDRGYRVYEAPEGFDVADGQKASEIERVESLPLAGYVRTEPQRYAAHDGHSILGVGHSPEWARRHAANCIGLEEPENWVVDRIGIADERTFMEDGFDPATRWFYTQNGWIVLGH